MGGINLAWLACSPKKLISDVIYGAVYIYMVYRVISHARRCQYTRMVLRGVNSSEKSEAFFIFITFQNKD